MRLNNKKLISLREKLTIIVGVVVAVAIIVALINIWGPRGPIEREVAIYAVDVAPYYTSDKFGFEITIFGDAEEDLMVVVDTPWFPSWKEIYAPFYGEKSVYVEWIMGGGPYLVNGGNCELTIRKLGGKEVYYEKSFTNGGSGFSIISYPPSVLTGWSTEMSFTVINDGDFPSECTGFVNIYVEILYEGQWDNLAIGGFVNEGSFTLLPGDYKQFHIDISIDETWRDQLKGQTRDVWLVGIGTTRPRFTLTFPSS